MNLLKIPRPRPADPAYACPPDGRADIHQINLRNRSPANRLTMSLRGHIGVASPHPEAGPRSADPPATVD